MSNRRKPAIRHRYRTGFLRSPAWFGRRDEWFRHDLSTCELVQCAACECVAVARELELHHLDYAGVTFTHGRWHARELHDDLVALHPLCHESLHRMLERDVVLARLRSRRNASLFVLDRLRIARAAHSGDA